MIKKILLLKSGKFRFSSMLHAVGLLVLVCIPQSCGQRGEKVEQTALSPDGRVSAWVVAVLVGGATVRTITEVWVGKSGDQSRGAIILEGYGLENVHVSWQGKHLLCIEYDGYRVVNFRNSIFIDSEEYRFYLIDRKHVQCKCSQGDVRVG